MQTKIKTIHEEYIIDVDDKSIGVLLNTSDDDPTLFDSLVYYYNKGNYIFFETIIDCIDYYLYGNDKMLRAYMLEDEFDNYYDNGIDDSFRNKLIFV